MAVDRARQHLLHAPEQWRSRRGPASLHLFRKSLWLVQLLVCRPAVGHGQRAPLPAPPEGPHLPAAQPGCAHLAAYTTLRAPITPATVANPALPSFFLFDRVMFSKPVEPGVTPPQDCRDHTSGYRVLEGVATEDTHIFRLHVIGATSPWTAAFLRTAMPSTPRIPLQNTSRTTRLFANGPVASSRMPPDPNTPSLRQPVRCHIASLDMRFSAPHKSVPTFKSSPMDGQHHIGLAPLLEASLPRAAAGRAANPCSPVSPPRRWSGAAGSECRQNAPFAVCLPARIGAAA